MKWLLGRIPALSTPRSISFGLFVVLLAPSVSSAAQVSTSTSSSTARTEVVILGPGPPQADPDNSGPAVAIVAGGAVYLVDCGPGVVRRAPCGAGQKSRARAAERTPLP